jgi:hypothetical protein
MRGSSSAARSRREASSWLSADWSTIDCVNSSSMVRAVDCELACSACHELSEAVASCKCIGMVSSATQCRANS